jgi:hypothetical protein
MLLRRSSATLAMLSLALTSTSALAAQCWDKSEMNSVRIHAFSTMLLVGSLKCRNVSPEVLENYNAFARARHEMLAGNSISVSAHFINRHGLRSGKIAFANYESKVANQYSGRTDDPLSCARIGAYSRLAMHASESDLLELAAAVATLPVEACPAKPAMTTVPMAASRPMLAAADTFDLEPPGSGYELPATAAPADSAMAAAHAAPAADPAPALAAAPKVVAFEAPPEAAVQPPDSIAGGTDRAIPAAATATAGGAEQAALQPAVATSPAPAAADGAPVAQASTAPAPSAADALAEAARALARAADAMQKPVVTSSAVATTTTP